MCRLNAIRLRARSTLVPIAGFALAIPGVLVALWRLLVAHPIVPSPEQLNIATFVVAGKHPTFLQQDFIYGSSDPSRFYTPLQVDLFDVFWRWAGTIPGAIGLQAIPIVVLTALLSAASLYALTRSVIASVIVAVAALNYREVLSSGDIWGFGPSWSILPRAWAAPFVFVVFALWAVSRDRRSWRFALICGSVAGLLVNIHPPTGVPLLGAVIGTSVLDALIHRARLREALGMVVAALVGSAPFIVGYLSNSSSAVTVDYLPFMDAARMRAESTLLPGLLDTLKLSFVPGTLSFAANLALVAAGVVSAAVIVSSGRHVSRLRAAVVLSAMLIVISAVFPVAAQAILMTLQRSPIATIDFVRGIRLLVPVLIIICGLGASAAIADSGPRRALIVPIAALSMLDVESAEALARSVQWLFLAVVVVLGLWSLSALPRLRHGAPVLVVGMLVIAQPLSTLAFATRDAGVCCAMPPPPDTERTTSELVAWARTQPAGTLFETSAVDDGAALRLRVEANDPVTWIAKDGNVLIYSDPAKAIEWAARARRAHDLVMRRDLVGLRAAAHEYGASLVLVDRLLWQGLVGGANFVVSWSGLTQRTPKDWIGIFMRGQPDNEIARLAVSYTGGGSSGSIGLTVPGLSADGTYEARLFSNDSWTRIGVSQALIVSGAAGRPESTATSPGPVSLAIELQGFTQALFQNQRFTVFKP